MPLYAAHRIAFNKDVENEWTKGSPKMQQVKQTVKVQWHNDCGEILHEEDLLPREVHFLIEEDERASYHNFVLPDGTAVDSVGFQDWYIAYKALAF